MKKIVALMIVILMLCSCFITASAKEKYYSARDLYEAWYPQLPDYICGVWSTAGGTEKLGGGTEYLTFGIQNNEAGNAGIRQILSLIEAEWTVRFVYQQFSRNYLLSIQEEMDGYYRRDLGLITTQLDDRNNCVIVQIRENRKDNRKTKDMVQEITEKYGKAVTVEYRNAQLARTVGEAQVSEIPSTSDHQPLLWTGIGVMIVSAIILLTIVCRRKKGTCLPKSSSISPKAVKEMIQKSPLSPSPDLDQKVMNRIRDCEIGSSVSAGKKNLRIPMWVRWTAATVCLGLLMGITLWSGKEEVQYTPPIVGTQYDTPLYSVKVEGGVYCLTPKVSFPKPFPGLSASIGLIYPKFTSVREMRQVIMTGAITKNELRDLTFHSQNTDHKIEICNLDYLYEFTTPDDCIQDDITWYGKYYGCDLDGETVRGEIYCYPEENYTEKFNREYKSFLSNPDITITKQRKTLSRFATEYYYNTSKAEWKYVCYEISTGDKKMYIQEEYLLAYSGDSKFEEPSSDIPSCIQIWGTEQAGYFYGYFTDFTERPSKQWLSEFGLSPLNE